MEPVDSGIGGNTKQFNDVVVAWPPTTAPGETTIPLLNANSTPASPSVTYGKGIGFTITLTNNGKTTASGVTLYDPLPSGTGVSWTLSSSTITGCSISGTAPTQTLSCPTFSVPMGVTETFVIASSAAAAGTYSNVATFSIGTQRTLAVATEVVSTISTGTALTSSANPSVYGQAVTFTATVTPKPAAGDTVTFKDGATTLGTGTTNASGIATFPISTLSVASHSITAVFAGDSNYTTSTSSPALSQAVNKANAATAITTNLSTATVTGQAYTVAYTVTVTVPGGGPITGTDSVTVSDGSGATCVGTVSTGSCSLKSTTASTKTITAAFAGDSNYNNSTSTGVSHTVNKANTGAALISSLNPSTVGQSVTFTATVSVTSPGTGLPASGETVTFKDGSTTLGTGATNASGVATYSTTALAQGSQSITAVYAGDSNYNTSTSSILTQTVNAAASTLKISPSSVNFATVYYNQVGAQFVTLTNSGTSSITVSKINVTMPGNAVADYGEITSCTPYISEIPGTLAAGKSCTIAVGFLADVKIYSPTASTATLAITDSAAGSPQTVPLSLTMINPQASLSATSLSFGNQKTGTTSAAKTLKITNTGNTPLNLSNLTISGNFAIASSGTTCAKNGTVQASASCQINVTFTPTSKGSKSGTLTISDNAQNSPQNVSLSGTAD